MATSTVSSDLTSIYEANGGRNVVTKLWSHLGICGFLKENVKLDDKTIETANRKVNFGRTSGEIDILIQISDVTVSVKRSPDYNFCPFNHRTFDELQKSVKLPKCKNDGMLCIFEATTSCLSAHKIYQLEYQLSYFLLEKRNHGKNLQITDIIFICGWVLPRSFQDSERILNRVLHKYGEKIPLLKRMNDAGRLFYVHGEMLSERLQKIETKLSEHQELLKEILEKLDLLRKTFIEPDSSKSVQIKFSSMEEFYTHFSYLPPEKVNQIKSTFENNDIFISTLHELTFENLKEIGLSYGLCKEITTALRVNTQQIN
jgi:hypothetical protein